MYGKQIVITGADGFLGSHLVKHFAELGFFVTAIVIKNSPLRYRIEGLENVCIVEGNLDCWEDLISAMPDAPDAFFHLAWAGVAPDMRNSVEIQFSNIQMAMDAARLAASINAGRFILPGSTTEYADCGQPINERACPSSQNAYGAAKISTRYLCRALCDELQLPFVYVVITGIYSADRVDNNVIYYTVSSLLDGKRPSFTKLEQLWDYVYIDDVMKAMSLIAEKGKANAFYVIGHGDNWPLANYIYQIRDAIDPKLPLGVGEIPYKNNIMPSSCVDMTSLREDTGFEPSVPFSEGIKKVIQTMREKR